MSETIETVEIINKYGLHMRPAHRFMDLANQYECDVIVRMGQRSVSGKSILDLTTLGAQKGTKLDIICTGDDAEACLSALVEFIKSLPGLNNE